MAARGKSDATEALKPLTYLPSALKAPGLLKQPVGWPTMPATPDGPTRSTSPRCWIVRSQHGTHPVPSSGSGPPDSVPTKTLEKFDLDA